MPGNSAFPAVDVRRTRYDACLADRYRSRSDGFVRPDRDLPGTCLHEAHTSRAICTWNSPARLPGRGMDQPHHVIVSCTRLPQQVARLRHFGAARLRRWGLVDCVETAELLISELVTNAVRYGEGDEVGFSLSHEKGEVRIEVSDGAPGRPTVRRPPPGEESGRGMLIVDALAEDWGTSRDGKRTWCTLTVPKT
ncbi:ATP-binding protein [Streptomyces malaysiensis]|uniref:ATP-binding protein n=2 Tax=Streptomyces malaysiensis TaxID=92644 RepID=UPI0031BB3C10